MTGEAGRTIETGANEGCDDMISGGYRCHLPPNLDHLTGDFMAEDRWECSPDPVLREGEVRSADAARSNLNQNLVIGWSIQGHGQDFRASSSLADDSRLHVVNS